MRAQGFKLVKNVERASSPIVIDETVATYNDNGYRVQLVDSNSSLAYRIHQAINPTMDEDAINAIHSMIDDDDYTVPDDVIANMNGYIDSCHMVNHVDVAGLTYTAKVSGDEDSWHIIGYYWKTPKNGQPFTRAVRVAYGTDDESPTVLPCNRQGSIVFKSYSISSLWALMKPAYRDYALSEAKALTKAHNTANTYHKVEYKLKRTDVGIAI